MSTRTTESSSQKSGTISNKFVSLGNRYENDEANETKVVFSRFTSCAKSAKPKTKHSTTFDETRFDSFEMENKNDKEKLEDEEIESSEDEESCTTSDKSFTVRQMIVLALLSFCQFTVGTSGSIQAPFFPFLAETKGLTSTTYGFVFGIFEIAVIVSSPFYGKIIPITKPRFLIIAGIFVVGGCTLLFGLLEMCPAGYPFTILSFAIRAVDGCGCAAFMTACYTMVASQFPNNVAKSFSVLETMFGIGFIAGPTLGGFLYEVGGYKLPFFVMGTMILLGCFLSIVFLPKTSEDVKITQKGQMLNLLTDVGILLDSAAVMSATLLLGFNSATLEPHLRQFNLTPSKIGFVFIIVGTVYGTTSPIWGFLLNRGLNSKVLCCLGYLFQSLCLFLIGPLPIINIDSSIWMIVVALLLGGLGVAIKMISAFTSSLHDSVMRGFPDDMVTHAMVSAIFTSSRSIGGLLGPTVGGVLLEHMGYQNGTLTMFSLEIILMCATVFYSLFYHLCKTGNVNLVKDPELQQIQLLAHTRISSEYL